MHYAPTHIQYQNSTYLNPRNLQCTWYRTSKYRTPKNECYFFLLIFPYRTSKYQKNRNFEFFTNHQQRLFFFSSFSHQRKKMSFKNTISLPFPPPRRHLFLPSPSNIIVPIPYSHPHPFRRIFTYFFGSNQAQWFHYIWQGTSNDSTTHTIRQQLCSILSSFYPILVETFSTR